MSIAGVEHTTKRKAHSHENGTQDCNAGLNQVKFVNRECCESKSVSWCSTGILKGVHRGSFVVTIRASQHPRIPSNNGNSSRNDEKGQEKRQEKSWDEVIEDHWVMGK